MDYGIDGQGNKICRGAQMGRCDIRPENVTAPIKLQMERLKWVDYDYDSAGCYWGRSNGDFIFCAWKDNTKVFVRAKSRNQAKQLVREQFPKAKFYR